MLFSFSLVRIWHSLAEKIEANIEDVDILFLGLCFWKQVCFQRGQLNLFLLGFADCTDMPESVQKFIYISFSQGRQDATIWWVSGIHRWVTNLTSQLRLWRFICLWSSHQEVSSGVGCPHNFLLEGWPKITLHHGYWGLLPRTFSCNRWDFVQDFAISCDQIIRS